MNEPADITRAAINGETAKIHWLELQRFFAQGTAIAVSDDLDLVDVACELKQDNKSQFEEWMAMAQVGPVSDEQAKEWIESDALMWAVVVRPWVLVQPVMPDSDLKTN